MAKKIINVGLLKHTVILITTAEKTLDEDGFEVKGKDIRTPVKAFLKSESYSDAYYRSGSDVTVERPDIRCIIRYRKGLTADDKVEINGVIFNIRNIENLNFENRFYELRLWN